jgi:hypothetical protein
MKQSSPREPRKPVDATTARNAVFINQLAAPGLGSLMAGRRVAGLGQLILALAGFALVMAWFVEVLVQFYQLAAAGAQTELNYRFLEAGVILFAAAWLWSLITSTSLLRQARTDEPGEPKSVPSPMTNLPGQPPKLS